MSEDDEHEIADRLHEILGPLDPIDRVRLASLTFAAVGVGAGLDDERLLAATRRHLALVREVKRTSRN